MFEQPPRPPGSKHLRAVRPPQPVWVNLAAAYPVEPSQAYVQEGMDLQAVVPGTLKMWDLTTTGHWVGWAVFAIGNSPASQWLPADALRPRAEPGRSGSSR
jgi:hypothetical protein